jgi:hypothetical protein
MVELEDKHIEQALGQILATIGLGMSHAFAGEGREEEPEQVFLCKALVASEKLLG